MTETAVGAETGAWGTLTQGLSTMFRRLLLGKSSSAIAPTIIVALLFVANAVVQPSFVNSSNWAPTLAVASTFILTGLAEVPPMLSGNGGIDVSVGPFAGFVTVFVVVALVPAGIRAPETLLPLVLGLGLASGAMTGLLVAFLRVPPIIVTLGGYLFYSGISTDLLPSPGGTMPAWVGQLTGSYGPMPGVLIVFAVVALCWYLLTRTAYYRNLLAVGGDDRTAYTAGVNVAMVRVGAYVLAGLFCALAGLLLAGTLGGGDATVGSNFTLTAIAAAALGGVSLAGGRGTLFGAAMGGAILYLTQNLLTVAHVSVFQLDIVDGAILVLALALNGSLESLRRRAGGQRVAQRPVQTGPQQQGGPTEARLGLVPR